MKMFHGIQKESPNQDEYERYKKLKCRDYKSKRTSDKITLKCFRIGPVRHCHPPKGDIIHAEVGIIDLFVP